MLHPFKTLKGINWPLSILWALTSWQLPCGWACLPFCPPLCPPWFPAGCPSKAKSSAGPRPRLCPLVPRFFLFLPLSQPRARRRERLRFFRPLLLCFSWAKISTTSWGIRSPNPSESRFDIPPHTGARPWKMTKNRRGRERWHFNFNQRNLLNSRSRQNTVFSQQLLYLITVCLPGLTSHQHSLLFFSAVGVVDIGASLNAPQKQHHAKLSFMSWQGDFRHEKKGF